MMKEQTLILGQDRHHRGSVFHLWLDWHIGWAKVRTEDQLYKYSEAREKNPSLGSKSSFSLGGTERLCIGSRI